MEEDNIRQSVQQTDPRTKDPVSDEKEAKRQRPAAMMVSRDSSRSKGENAFWNHLNGGELNAREVRKPGNWKQSTSTKMRVFERVTHEAALSKVHNTPRHVDLELATSPAWSEP